MDEIIDSESNNTLVKFYFFSINFINYKHVEKSSSEIIHEVMKFLSVQHQLGKGILIDRDENKKGSQRPLFITSSVFMYRNKRIRGTLALLKAGRSTMLKPHGTFELVPLDKNLGQVAELTHFFIDFNRTTPILCLQFNADGPRSSDLEYYFRVVARDQLKLAYGVELEMFMNVPIEKALSEFKNVLNFQMKVHPPKLANLDTALVREYLTGMTNLNQKVNPSFLKIEALFQTKGRVQSSQLNQGANKMFRRFLEAFQAKKENIDVFDNFVVKYEDLEGREAVFSLMTGKREVEKFINLETASQKEIYEMIENNFDDFVNKYS